MRENRPSGSMRGGASKPKELATAACLTLRALARLLYYPNSASIPSQVTFQSHTPQKPSDVNVILIAGGLNNNVADSLSVRRLCY
jgi:hypothetical protein